MKIWTTTVDEDGAAPVTIVHMTEQAAQEQFARTIARMWSRHADAEDKMPVDPSEAYEALCEMPGFFDQISQEAHEISAHPAIQAALAQMDELVDRISNPDDETDEPADIAKDAQIAINRALTADDKIFDEEDCYAPRRAAAREIYGQEGAIEIESGAAVSIGADGAYVAAWLFVPNDEDNLEEGMDQ